MKKALAGLLVAAAGINAAQAVEAGGVKFNFGLDLGYRYVDKTGGGNVADFDFSPSGLNIFTPYVKASKDSWYGQVSFTRFKGSDKYTMFIKNVFGPPVSIDADLTHQNIEAIGGYTFKNIPELYGMNVDVFGGIGRDSFKFEFDNGDSFTEKVTYLKAGAAVTYKVLYVSGYIGKHISASTTLSGEEVEKKWRYGMELGSRFDSGKAKLRTAFYVDSIDMAYKGAKNEYMIYGFKTGVEF